MNGPVTFTWNGEAMVPLPRFARMCGRQFQAGENYQLVVHEERSSASHRHFFAVVNEAWLNLPDDLALEFPSSEHLRKWSLVQAGFAHERSIACASKQEARKIAAFIRPMDEYAVIAVRDSTIKVFTALSQSVRAMGKKDFQASKDAVLEVLANLIGVTPKELQAQSPSIAPDRAAERERSDA